MDCVGGFGVACLRVGGGSVFLARCMRVWLAFFRERLWTTGLAKIAEASCCCGKLAFRLP